MDYHYGLLGEHLGHSASPEIHGAFGNADYGLYEVQPKQLEMFLKSTYLRGLNVTIPYKQAVIPYCAKLDTLAEKIGSVNTMVRAEDGSWVGYNTDAYGLRYMVRRAGMTFAGQDVVVLGNGGVSQTVQAVAKCDGAASVRVVSRRGELNYDNIEKCADATILVNTTPVGMYPNAGKSVVDLRMFPKLRGVVELIYNPCRTALIQQAISLEIPYTQGFQMLVAQAKQAEELFFGTEISAEKMLEVGSKLQQNCENIVLIGMPGCGKSTIGRLLGQISGMKVFDTDDEIVRKFERNITDIFAEDGEATFREMEREVVADLAQKRGVILCTGGGVVVTPENESALRQNGRIYTISRDIELLAKNGRPLSLNGDIHAMAEKRAPLYAKFADVTVENNASAEETTDEIWSDFCAYTRYQWTESESFGDA